VTGTATYSSGTITFNGTNQAFSNTAYVFPSNAYSMFAVYSNTTAPGATSYMNVVYGNGGYPMLGVYGSSKFVSARSVVANTGALSPNIVASNVLVGATYTPSTFSPFINGSAETTLAGTTLAATGIYVGGPTNYFNGSVSEILIYSATLTQTQRQSVEGYLAWKWGLQVQAPAPVQTPLSISGCQLWLDAADTTKIAPAAGGTLTSWTDKSGTGKTVTVASAPSYSLTSFNGLPSVTFASGNSLTIPITAPGTNDIAMFAVWKATVGTANNDVFSIGSPNSGGETAIGWNTGSAAYIFYRYGGPDSLSPTTYSSNITIVQSATKVSGFMSMYINGTSPASTGSETYNQTNTTIYIGGGSGFVLQGQVAEIIYYRATLTTTQRQSVENYLMGKWGIKSSLPATHPFYSLPAFSRVFGPLDIPGCALWLDAADSTKLTNTGTTLNTITDKSGATTASIVGTVTYNTNTLNGLPTLGIVSGGIKGDFLSTFYVHTSFIVIKMNASGLNSFGVAFSYNQSVLPTRALDTAFGYYRNLVRNPNTVASQVTQTVDSYFLWTAYLTPSVLGLRYNGQTDVTSSISTDPYNLQSYGVGYNYESAGVSGWQGNVAEAITYSTNLTTSQIQQIEGYLAAKWGLLSSVVSGHPFKSIPPSTSQPPQFQEVTPGNWKYDWQPYLSNLAAANSSGLTITTANITGGATYSGGWWGGVLAPNGNIYFCPVGATNILVLNPTTGVTSNLTGGATYTASGWSGGVLAPNGNIYFAPLNAPNVLVLNPTTGVTSNLTGGATYTTGGWSGGVLAPNGNIYFTPYQSTNTLVLNPTTGVTSNLTGGGTYNASYGYFGSVLAPNGNIYFCPLNSSSILFLNPNTGVTSNITGGATYTLANAWIGGVLHPNGKIYFTPYSATNILVLDPATGVTSNLTGGATFTGNQGWSGGVLGPNGNIYFTPYQATNVLVLNPTTGVTSNLTGGGTYNATGWFGGGTLAPNGNVYFSPSSATNIMRLNFAGLSQLPSSNYCLSAWTNKR